MSENKNMFDLLSNDCSEHDVQQVQPVIGDKKQIIPDEVTNDCINKNIPRRKFQIGSTQNVSDDWKQVKTFKPKVQVTKKIMDITVPVSDPINIRAEQVQQVQQDQPKEDIKRKIFSMHIPKHTGTIQLPAYYHNRSLTNEFEIPQSEYDWVRKVGGLEKSDSIEHMLRGIMTCAITYFDDRNCMMKNKYFANKMSVDQLKQEENIELLCMQTTSILFHRLIKSDSVETIKTILRNLPLYKAVPGNPLNPADAEKINRSEGLNAYMRMKHKFINDLRIVQRNKNMPVTEEMTNANARISTVEKKWTNYILQSVWNGNNPIHDCLYYGASSSLDYILSYYFEIGMTVQLNTMMLVPNVQNETHSDIVTNGKKACESQAKYIIKKKQYEECENLYNKTIETLRKSINEIVGDEAEMIVPTKHLLPSVGVSIPCETKEDINNSGDNQNVCDLIKSGEVEKMINHIKRLVDSNNYSLIEKTIELWQSTVNSDTSGQYADYLEDVKNHIKDLIKH